MKISVQTFWYFLLLFHFIFTIANWTVPEKPKFIYLIPKCCSDGFFFLAFQNVQPQQQQPPKNRQNLSHFEIKVELKIN